MWKINLVTFIAVIPLFWNCNGQSASNSNPADTCNQTAYGSQKYVKMLPDYICIPHGYVIDDYVRLSDLNRDGFEDFLAVKYNRKSENQEDGEATYWNFYTRSKDDSVYALKYTLSNIVPPFIKDISYEYQESHPVAAKIFEEYPRRLSRAFHFQVNSDTIRLPYKFDDSYGKTFVFVFNRDNWYLKKIEYFFGELPMYWWKDSDFFYSLSDKLKVIETRNPQVEISIDKLDLRQAFKYRDIEWSHITEWHVDRIDKTKWPSVDKVQFEKCYGPDLPKDSIY